MDPKFTDANCVLKLGREKVGQKFFIIGAVGLVFGALMISFGGKRDIEFSGYAAALLGFALCMYEMHRFFHPGKPMLTLAPEGLRYNIEFVKEIFVPWHEVKALRQIRVADMSGATRWPLRAKFENVLALVVTNAFYDRAIHVSNPILRGPGWGNIFIPDDRKNVMQFALHHEILPITAEELYAAVEARWTAFRDQTTPPANKAAP
ncbi:MAG: hypothetical protein KF904_17805 [Rhodoblastus sp.]|nr:hypothetical protein [Rhodoblastus sp.]